MKNFSFLADIHLHNAYPYGEFDAEGINSRTTDIIKNVKQWVDFSIQKKVTCAYILGDIFESDSKLLRRLFMSTILPLIEAEIPIIILAGNHDGDGKNFVMDDIGLLTQTSKVRSSVKLLVQNKTRIISKDGINFLLIPWQLKHNIAHDIDVYKARANKNETNILLLHSGLDEAEAGVDNFKTDSNLSAKSLEFFDLVIDGHIHKPQTIGNIEIVGSCACKDFGERGEKKRFLYVEIEGKVINKQSIPLNDRQFTQINSNEEGFSDKIDKQRNGDIVKVILSGNKEKIGSFDRKRLIEILKERGASKVLFETDEIKDKVDVTEDTKGYSNEQLVEFYIEKFCEEPNKEKFLEYGKKVLVK